MYLLFTVAFGDIKNYIKDPKRTIGCQAGDMMTLKRHLIRSRRTAL